MIVVPVLWDIVTWYIRLMADWFKRKKTTESQFDSVVKGELNSEYNNYFKLDAIAKGTAITLLGKMRPGSQ